MPILRRDHSRRYYAQQARTGEGTRCLHMRPVTTDLESGSRHATSTWSWAAGAVMCAGIAVAAVAAQVRPCPDSAGRRITSSGAIARRDHPLRAVQLLEYRPVGADPRVRFEWNQVPGAREYRLLGHWSGAVSWTMHTREYQVTSLTATTWTPERVTLEVPLPLGNHSWRLVAVFGTNDLRALGDSTPLSFAVK